MNDTIKIKPTPLFTISKVCPRRICFSDVMRQEHVIPIANVRLQTQVLEKSKNPEEEPDELAFLMHIGRPTVTISAALYYDLLSYLMGDGRDQK